MNPLRRDVIIERLADYQKEDVTKKRQQLIEEWRKHHPAAALEQSPYLHPLMLLQKLREPPRDQPNVPCEPHEIWANDVYQVTVRRYEKDPVFGTRGGMVQIGISALDGTARHDWREFQAIKNQLAGPETEAFELYPAESRLLDPSNYYTLWCFPGLKRIKVGHGPDMALVLDADEAISPQRALPKTPEAAK